MNDDQTLPDSFPLAWRLPQPANGGKRRVPPRVPPQIPCLACFGRALSNLRASSTAGSSTGSEALATAAVTERVQSCPWMRTIGQRSSDDARSVQSSQRYLVPCAAQMRDLRSIDPLCVSVVELSIAVRESGAEPIDQLGRVICGLAAPRLSAADDAHELARATYEALATVPNLVDALRAGVATADVAAILAAAAAAHDARVNGEGQSNRVVFHAALRRIRAAGELLLQASAAPLSSIASIASIQRPAWTVLYDAPDALDGDCDAGMMRVAALIALGGRAPVLVEAMPSAETPASASPLARQQCCFVATMEGLVGRTSANGRRTWGLSDALIPCNAVPIRTKHYVEYLGAIAAYANRCIGRLSSAASREECCAWALVALADATRGFAQMIRAWARMRAHEPPATGRVRWVVARALLGQRGLDVGALAACLGAGVRDATSNRRIAAFCVATRTPTGIALLVHDRALAAGVVGPTTPASVSPDDGDGDDWDAIDCLSQSPSGTLEFGVYETGWSEWSAGNATDDGGPYDEHDSTNVADVVRCEISRVLLDLVDAARAQSDVGRRRLTSILRLSLLPDNLLGRHWKYAIENVQSDLECALAASSHGGRVGPRLITGRAGEPEVGVGADMALKAAVFRRRCLRALHDASRYPLHDTHDGVQVRRRAALATWLTNESGDGVVFARAFPDLQPLEAELMVIEYERAMRRSLAAFDREGHAPTASLVTNTARTARGTRVARLGVQGVVFVDDASDAAVAGSGKGRFLEYCSSNAVLAADDCAVSVVHWPQTSL